MYNTSTVGLLLGTGSQVEKEDKLKLVDFSLVVMYNPMVKTPFFR